MVALVAGNSLGLNLTSLATLGARGVAGNATLGRGTDRVTVNVANGNLILQNQDDALAGPGLWSASQRTYNSQEHLAGDFRLPGLQPPRLATFGAIGQRNSSIVRKDADGSEDRYAYDATRRLYLSSSGAGAYDTLRYRDNQLVWTDGDTGTTEYYARYQDQWQLVRRQDTDGNALAFLYNKEGQVQSVANSSGETVYYDYRNRLLAQVRSVTIDANGTAQTVRVRYGHDSFGRLDTVTVDLTPEDGSIADGRVYTTRYGYDGPSERITSIRESDGSSLAIAYVGSGNDIRVASVTNALGETMRFAYDAANRRTTVTDALGLATRYDYDAQGQLLRITGPTIAGGAQVQSFLYNARGDVLQVTDAEGHVSAMEYDANGNQVLQRDAAGNVIARSFDAQNQLLTETLYVAPDPDSAGPARASQPQTTHTIYDAGKRNHVRFIVSPEGRVTEYRYNATGQRIVALRYAAAYRDSSAWQVAYPQALPPTPLGLGAPVSAGGYMGAAPTEAMLAAWAAAQDSSQVVRTDYRYDFRGQLQQQLRYPVVPDDGSLNVATAGGANPNLYASTIGNGNSVGNGTGNGNANGKGNGVGNAIDGNVGNGIGNANGNGNGKPGAAADITQYVYDAFGRLLQTVSPNGGVTSYAYDGLNRLLAMQDAEGNFTATRYDDASRRTTLQSTNGLHTVSAFDAAGRLTSLMQTDVSGQPLAVTIYDYDADGRLRHSTDPTGVERWMLYDEASRLVAEIDGNRSLIEYVYDHNNQLLQTTRHATPVVGDLQAVLPPDALARLRPPAHPDDSRSWRLYDAANRLAAEIDAEGLLTRTEYDGASRVVRTTAYANAIDVSTLTAQTTLAQLLPAASTDDRVTRRLYDNDGLLRATLDAEGYLQEWRYDAAGQQVAQIRYATATDPALRANGTLSQLRPAASAADILTQRIYNARSQLTAEIDGEGYLTSYRYDGNGNRTGSTRHARALTEAERAMLVAGGIAASWRPAPSQADGIQTWRYDLLDRVIASTDYSGTVTRYQYDSMGRLVQTTLAAGSDEARVQTRRYDLQGRLLAELSGEGNAALAALANPSPEQTEAIWQQHAMRYQYDAAGRLLTRTDANGNRDVFYYDADGQLRYAVNAAGEVQAHQYDALGRELMLTRYATRLTSTQLASLQGGLLDAPRNTGIPTMMASLATPGADSNTIYRYDRAGRLLEITNALGQRIASRYSTFGQLIGKTTIGTENGDIVEQSRYDRRGLLTSTLRDATGLRAATRTEYDAFGRAIRRTDANGNLREQRYDRLGRMVQTVDATSAVFATGYDAFSRTISRTDALGNTTRIAYDHAARSSTVTTPEGITVTTVMNRHGQTQRVVDGNGNVTTSTYDRNGNLVSTATALAVTTQRFDAGDRLIETVDGNGTRTVLAYDAANRMLSRIVDPGGLALATTYVHDALGRMVRSTDANGIATTYHYDALGQLREQVLDPNGLALTIRYRWNSRGQQLSVTDQNGVTTRYAYDNLGRRISETVDPDGLALTTRYAYNANGNLVTRTDANGQISRYAYDGENRQVASVDAEGGVVLTAYDANGRIASTVAYAQAIPLDGLPLAAPLASITARLSSNANDKTSQRVYDRDGRLSATVDGTGAVVTYRYDGNGNTIERRSYARPIALASWRPGTMPAVQPDDAHDMRLRTLYDAANRAIASIDGVGALTLQRYDANGNLLSRTAYATPVDPNLALTFLATDASRIMGASNDIASNTDHLASIAERIASSADRADQYRYDAANRVTLHVDGVGAVTCYAYDANGNLLRSIAHATALAAGQDPATVAASAADRLTDRAYDAANQLLWEVDALGGVTAWQRDANGNVLRIARHARPVAPPAAAMPPRSADALRQAVQPDATADRISRQAYDAANRLLFAIDAEGAVTAYRYDGLGQRIASTAHANTLDTQALTAIDAQGGTSPGGSPQASGTIAIAARLAAIASRIAPDAAQDRGSRQYVDAAGRIAATMDALGNVTASRYDALGRLLQREQLARPLDLATSDLPATLEALQALLRRDPYADHVEHQTWDAAGRLVSKTDALGHAESWTHDALGNQLSYRNALGAVWTYDHDAAGRTIRETTPEVDLVSTTANFATDALSITHAGPAAVVSTLAYDALGNLIARTEAQGRPEERTTRYAYDALGRQVRTTFPPVGVYAADLDDPGSNGSTGLAARTERIETLYTETRYDALGNAISGRDVAGAISRKTYDRLGRLDYEVDALGQVTGREYNAFGDITRLTRYQFAVALPQADIDSAGLRAALQTSDNDRSLQQAYDRTGRLLRSEQSAVDAYDSSAPEGQQAFHAGLVTTQRYNAFGERIQTRQLRNPLTNAWLASTAWYDRAGREIASMDAAGYLSTQTWDARGNLLSRTEFAQPQADPGAALPAAIVASDDDRSTVYAYDRASRKIAETRLRIEVADADTGVTQRRDVSATYGYDALGNQTRVTDGLGATTFTWYDALGHIRAVAAPGHDSTASGAMLIPLTEFRRDAHGNVLLQTAYANGAAAADERGYTRAAASASDRVTLSRYDSHGHLVQSQDAAGVVHHQSFDARGNLAKSWQRVTAADGISQRTLWQAWRYDALGRQSAMLSARDDGGAIIAGTRYNAFGEIVRQGTDERWATYYDRDAAGRVWRTNDKDGIERIALYDLQGNATVEVRSDGAAPLAVTQPLDALVASHARRVDNRYDALGRLVGMLDAARDDSPLQDDGDGGLSWTSADGAERFAWQAAGLDWMDLAITRRDGMSTVSLRALPPGDYGYRLSRYDAGGALQVVSGMLHVEAGQTARTVDAQNLPRIGGVSAQQSTIGGIASLDDAAAWLVFADPGADYVAQFQYRATGSSAWLALPLTPRGNGLVGVNRAAIPAGAYDYQLLLTRPGASSPSRTIAGKVDLPAYAPTGQKAMAVGIDGRILGALPARVLRLPLPPAGVDARLRLRVIDADANPIGDWQSPAVQTDVLGVDTQDQLLGYQKLDLASLPPAQYEVELTWLQNGQPIAQSLGQLDARDTDATSYTDHTPDYLPAYTVAATAPRITFTTEQLLRPEIRQTLDRWGNALTVNDARSLAWVTSTRYNADNHVVEQAAPAMQLATGETVRPVTRFLYDALGRQIGMRDANGNLTRWRFDNAGQLQAELRADGGIVTHQYDAFGNKVATLDARGHRQDMRYDALDRRIDTRIDGALVASASYDDAGRMSASGNGAGEMLRYRYDLRGNVVAVIQPMGQATAYAYDTHNRQVAMTDANGRTATWTYDDFGLLLAHTDIGGAVYTYQYDAARQLVEQSNSRGQHILYGYDAAGRQIRIDDRATGKLTTYRLDALGNHLAERTLQGGELLQDNRLAYDSAGRLVRVTDSAAGRISIAIGYDAAGNRRHIVTDIAVDGASQHVDGWYVYDAMHRQTVGNALDAQGTLGTQGRRIAYDFNGNRISDTWHGPSLGGAAAAGGDTELSALALGLIGQAGTTGNGDTTATYAYDAQNRLIASWRDGQLVQQRQYDAAGRLAIETGGTVDEDTVKQLNSALPETDRLPERRSIYSYDANGRMTYLQVLHLDGGRDYDMDYRNAYDAVGNVLSYQVHGYSDDGYTNTFVHTYAQYEGDVITDTRGSSTVNDDGASHRRYDVNGDLITITDDAEGANNRSYRNDAFGRALAIHQNGRTLRQLIVNGEVLGRYGNGVNPYDAKDDDNHPQFATIKDLNFSYQIVNATHPGSAPGSYLVAAGDTLQSIARRQYGDAGYWYQIALANGLDGDSALVVGRKLDIPSITGTTFNRADSFRPYDASIVIGDTTPDPAASGRWLRDTGRNPDHCDRGSGHDLHRRPDGPCGWRGPNRHLLGRRIGAGLGRLRGRLHRRRRGLGRGPDSGGGHRHPEGLQLECRGTGCAQRRRGLRDRRGSRRGRARRQRHLAGRTDAGADGGAQHAGQCHHPGRGSGNRSAGQVQLDQRGGGRRRLGGGLSGRRCPRHAHAGLRHGRLRRAAGKVHAERPGGRGCGRDCAWRPGNGAAGGGGCIWAGAG